MKHTVPKGVCPLLQQLPCAFPLCAFLPGTRYICALPEPFQKFFLVIKKTIIAVFALSFFCRLPPIRRRRIRQAEVLHILAQIAQSAGNNDRLRRKQAFCKMIRKLLVRFRQLAVAFKRVSRNNVFDLVRYGISASGFSHTIIIIQVINDAAVATHPRDGKPLLRRGFFG